MDEEPVGGLSERKRRRTGRSGSRLLLAVGFSDGGGGYGPAFPNQPGCLSVG